MGRGVGWEGEGEGGEGEGDESSGTRKGRTVGRNASAEVKL
jgi:hypothetical protein